MASIFFVLLAVRSNFKRFVFVAASLFWVLLLWTNAGASPADEATELNNRAVVCVQNQNYEEAVGLLKKAIALQPDLHTAYYNLGRIYLFIGEWDLAIEAFKQTLALKPASTEAMHQLAVSYNQSERYAEAVEYLKVLQLQPARPDSLTELGFAYSQQGHPQEAIGFFKDAIRIRPDFSDAYNNLGVVYFRTGQVSAAIESLQHAIRLTPNLAVAHYNLGYALTKGHREREAIASYKQALLLKPDFAEVRNNLAVLYLQHGQRSLALEQYHLLQSINSEMAQNLFEMIFQDKILKVPDQSRE
jgi:tetratricopeptide (TPR) repeat protein